MPHGRGLDEDSRQQRRVMEHLLQSGHGCRTDQRKNKVMRLRSLNGQAVAGSGQEQAAIACAQARLKVMENSASLKQ